MMPEKPVESKELVRDGVVCIGCGYDLAGLQQVDDTVCPECGEHFENSYTRPLLRNEGVAWLERVSDGLYLFQRSLWSAVMVLVVGVPAMFLFFPLIAFSPRCHP